MYYICIVIKIANMPHQNNLDQSKALEFILGGNAIFTIMSKKTNTRYTYKVLADRNNDKVLRVSVMFGSDNTSDYREIGIIDLTDTPQMKRTGMISAEDVRFIAFDHVFLNLLIGLYMPMLEIWHEGRCCRCGRLLTVPESIENGIGPECILKGSKIRI